VPPGTGTAGATMDDEARVLSQLEAAGASYLEDLLECMRRPSVSMTGEGLEAMARWLVDYLTRLGAEAGTVPGRVAPIVEGELQASATAPRLLFYELYDTQPAEEAGWLIPPFEPAVVDGEGGARIIGRGAFNSKGPLMAFLTVLRAFHDAGVAPPLQVRFLVEGEEEIGSPSLAPYVRSHARDLAACDAVFLPYPSTNRRGETVLRLGFKGLVLLELSVTGGAWGGPAAGPIHAMHTAWVANPTWDLVRALASLQGADGELLVDGLDAITPPPTAEDARLLRDAAARLDPRGWLEELGVERFRVDDREELFRRFCFDPTLNIDAFDAGRVREGEEPATLMAHRAATHVDLRLVPGMEVDATLALLRAHLDRRGFAHVAIRVKNAYPSSRTMVHESVVQSLIAACSRHADRVVALPLHAGGVPMHLFGDELGLPFAFGGVGHGGRSHAPNEYLELAGFRGLQRSITSFLFDYAGRVTRA
jgi:acetylornithine deacetylase/succinyl-diaminopimelate desuccinylase-like protein